MVHYEVVSSVELGGALVRDGRSLTSKQVSRLGVGAVVSELERVGERLRFQKVSGSGPQTGWVSAQLLSKCDSKAPSAKSQGYQGKSLLAQAEAKVLLTGPSAALAEASKGQDGGSKILESMAHLAAGHSKEAAMAAEAAQKILEGKKEGLASASLALALALLAAGEATRALGIASEAQSSFREVGDKQMEASAMCTVANARLAMKDLNIAEATARDALAIFREIGDIDGEEAARLTFSDACVAKDGQSGHRTVAKEQAAHCRRKGDKIGEGEALRKLAQQGLLASGTGREEALKLSREALVLFQQAGDKRGEASALHAAAAAELLGPAEALAESRFAEEALEISKAIGDEAGQVDLLFTLSALELAREQHGKALQRAEEVRALAKKLGDPSAEARGAHAAAAASLAAGKMPQALALSQEAAGLFRASGDLRGEACALQTAAGASTAAEAVEALTKAASLLAAAEDPHAKAMVELQLANMLLATKGSMVEIFKARQTAAFVAERSRSHFLIHGDKRNQARASHAAGQGKILLGDHDGGIEAAMQAVVLARACGDRWLEACALRTAMGGQVCKSCHAEAYRMAKEVKMLFQKLGSKNIEEAVSALILQLEEALPRITPAPRLTVSPKDVNMNLTGSSVFTQSTNCIVWSLPTTQQVYIMYCLELLKFCDDLKNIPDKINFIVLTRGVMARHLGEPVPSQYEGVIATTVWAVVRTIRLESPKLLVATVDVPSSCTVHEMTDCIRAAQQDAGPRNEISFVIDRGKQLGKRPY